MTQHIGIPRRLLAATITFAVAALPALADFIPLPVKWSQPIGFDASGLIIGKDRLSDHTAFGATGQGIVRADDFICNIPLPIVAVRWWGSYIGEGPANGLAPRPKTGPAAVGPFDISFHFSTANGNPTVAHPFSLPLDPPLYLTTVHAQEEFVGVDQAGDFVYRYDAFLPTPFQQQGTQTNPLEYFLDIDKPTRENWGWHESPFGGLDFPAVAPGHFGPWTSDPPHDLAFELMVVPEPSSAALAGLSAVLFLGWVRGRRQIRR